MAQSNVPVMEAARAAYRFWREAWRPTLGALLLLAAAAALQYYFTMTGRTGLGLLASLGAFAASMVAYGALFRLAFADLRPEEAARTGPGGLQWGGMETRLLLAMLLVFLLAFVAMILFVFVFVIAIMVAAGGAAAGLEGADSPQEVAEALGPRGLITLGVVFLAAAVLAIWVSVRLVLVLPATAGSGKVQVFETWRLTKGQFWRIFAAMIIASAPAILWSMFSGAVDGAMGEEGAREGTRVLPPAAAAVMAVLGGLVTGVLQAPLTAGLGAFLY
ncbi:MAG TPA: hypothetical protein VF699_13495, partial [Caulobacteraceae bacterium]